MSTLEIKVSELQAGDYVIPARATVKEVQLFAGLAIVDFDDKTATAPIPQNVKVQITRA
jgi:hypothetical protein